MACQSKTSLSMLLPIESVTQNLTTRNWNFDKETINDSVKFDSIWTSNTGVVVSYIFSMFVLLVKFVQNLRTHATIHDLGSEIYPAWKGQNQTLTSKNQVTSARPWHHSSLRRNSEPQQGEVEEELYSSSSNGCGGNDIFQQFLDAGFVVLLFNNCGWLLCDTNIFCERIC